MILGRRAFASQSTPSWNRLRKHLFVSAIPMIGFGFIDNTIMIRAGDWLNNSVGEIFPRMNALTAAACGQVISDVTGVVFGSSLAAAIAWLGLKSTNLSPTQREMRITRCTGTFGAALGMFLGCSIGMLNLLFMDIGLKEKKRKEKELRTIFQTVTESARVLMDASISTIWLLNKDGDQLWTSAGTGLGENVLTLSVLPSQTDACTGLTVSCALSKDIINVSDCYRDMRFNDELDKKNGLKTVSMLCAPVVSSHDGSLLGVLQFINKQPGNGDIIAFSDEDCKMAKLIAGHVSIFIQQASTG